DRNDGLQKHRQHRDLCCSACSGGTQATTPTMVVTPTPTKKAHEPCIARSPLRAGACEAGAVPMPAPGGWRQAILPVVLAAGAQHSVTPVGRNCSLLAAQTWGAASRRAEHRCGYAKPRKGGPGAGVDERGWREPAPNPAGLSNQALPA